MDLPGPSIIGPGPAIPEAPHGSAWDKLRTRANSAGSIIALFVFLVAAGTVTGYYYSQSKKAPTVSNQPTVENLTPAEISKLNEIGTNLGNANQTLNIGANALFRGDASVTGNLSIGGQLNANGPVTLSQLNITGNTAATGLNVGSNLIVTGTTTLQGALTVNNLTTINSNLNVTGNASVGVLTAGGIAVRNITISGPLTIAHLVTQGLPPVLSPGDLGSGGTASISGNDTAGTLNFNTGSTPPSGVLGTITFKASYGGTVHVILSPITGAAASTPAYATRSASGFQVHTDVAPPGGSTLSYDYIVVQ